MKTKFEKKCPLCWADYDPTELGRTADGQLISHACLKCNIVYYLDPDKTTVTYRFGHWEWEDGVWEVLYTKEESWTPD